MNRWSWEKLSGLILFIIAGTGILLSIILPMYKMSGSQQANTVLAITTALYVASALAALSATVLAILQILNKLGKSSKDIQWLTKEISNINNGHRDIDSKLEERKKVFQNTSIFSFYFIDRATIENAYNDIFYELVVDRVTSEAADVESGDIKANLRALGAAFGGKKSRTLTKDYKIGPLTLQHMFRRLQTETLGKGQVLLGLEGVDIDLTETHAFEEEISKLQKRFGLMVSSVLVEETKKKLTARAAENALQRLENASGWVLIDGKFEIEDAGEYYKCVYIHPVNRYLKDLASPVTITVTIKKSQQTNIADTFTQFIGEDTIPLKVYGKITMPIDRRRETWDLRINPLAIY